MIDFRPFYQQIATTNLSAWLETLPAQLKQWEKQPMATMQSGQKLQILCQIRPLALT